jgi:MYXO-CTERM domain-containing protein
MLCRKFVVVMAVAVGTFGSAAPIASADFVAQWDFNNQTLAPSLGAGTLGTVGGATGATFNQAAGSSDPVQPGFGWQTSGYPSQGAASGTAGIEIGVSTVGYENGGLTFDALDVFETNVGSTWFNNRTADLSAIAGAADNPLLVLRLVSIFAPGTSAYQATDGASTYGGGTTRFDMITIEGTPSTVPAPAAPALLALAGVAGGRRRRRD